MASRVVMPKLSDTMEEGKILRWLRKEGDKVETGQTLAEVETDKATVEMEAYTNGTIRKLVAQDGDTIKVGDLIAVIGAPDEDISALLEAAKPQAAPAPAPAAPRPAAAAAPRPAPRAVSRPAAPAAAPAPRPAPQPVAAVPSGDQGRSLRASPLALRMAAEAGIDLEQPARLRPAGPHHQAGHRSGDRRRLRGRGPPASPCSRPAT